MGTYRQLVAARVPTRAAATLTGVSRATAARDTKRRTSPAPEPQSGPVSQPANALSRAECEAVLAALNSAEFVDTTPMQVYATLLEQGIYLCSVSTMYRILGANAQVTDRRRLARHPTRACPELVATAPGQVNRPGFDAASFLAKDADHGEEVSHRAAGARDPGWRLIDSMSTARRGAWPRRWGRSLGSVRRRCASGCWLRSMPVDGPGRAARSWRRSRC